MEITAKDKRRWITLMRKRLVQAYGLGEGPEYAWHHMSEAQRENAWSREATLLVLAQDESIAKQLSFEQAQAMLRLAFDADAQEKYRRRRPKADTDY